jgi:hypothetical protein
MTEERDPPRPPGPPGLQALLEEASRLAGLVGGKVLSDPRGQEAVALAVGLALASLQRLEEVQVEVMKAAGIPGRQDYQELAKQLARVKRKARELAKKLEERQAAEAARKR